MRALSILFTNNTLASRSGSELWVRDVCRALLGRGHHPIAFSLITGAVAQDLRAATVPVVTDLANVAVTPDLIHGHHHLETLIAALHFPGVPIVHFCHGWLPWEEQPLRHPSIARYVAVDGTCADRLISEHGIPEDQVDLLLNFVDVKTFLPRAPLPDRPRRALILNNDAGWHGYAASIREACQEQGIDVELAGIRSGCSVERPQDLLPGFDLVFAKARSALEAMAVGCSVILADGVGAGPLVTERDFARMRAGNFGVRWLQQAHSVAWYRSQIAAYDAAEAGRISSRIREEAALEPAIDRLLNIYAHAIDGHRLQRTPVGQTVTTCVDAQRAAARHLSSVALQFKRSGEFEAAVHILSGELTAAHAIRDGLLGERQALLAQAESLANEVTEAHDLRQQLTSEQGRAADLRAAVNRLSGDLAAARTSAEQSVREREALLRQTETLTNDLATSRSLSLELALERDELRQLVSAYQRLPILRLRDQLLRWPVFGTAAQRAARWLSEF
jgi:hypothetical protein